jgi:UrcA family protein
MKVSTRSALLLPSALLLGWSATTLGAPNPIDAVPTKTVNLRDLDLGKADGARTLYDRITSAARTVCRDADRRSMRTCRTHAVEEAVNRVGNPLLSSIHGSAVEGVEEVVLR